LQAMRRVYGYLRAPGAKVPPKWYFYHRHAECLDKINNSDPPPATIEQGEIISKTDFALEANTLKAKSRLSLLSFSFF